MAKTNKKKVAAGVGLGLAVVAGATAGYYFYGSKHASGNRRKAARWAHDLKADVIKNAKKMKKMDERAYHTIVNEAMKAYKNVRTINKGDLESAAAELKANWKTAEREIDRVIKAEKKVVRTKVKKAVKKVKRAIPRTLAKRSAKKFTKKVAKKRS